MSFQSFLFCCTDVITNEVAQGLTQKQIALTYAMAIVSETHRMDLPDWPKINSVIIDRWGAKGLERVKKKAWKLIENRAITDRIMAEAGQNL
jgi:hypothetical protein